MMTSNLHPRLACLGACALILTGAGLCHAQDDLEKLKRQTREFEWAALNPDKSKTGEASKWALQLRADGSWPDIDYTDRARGLWKTSAHLVRTEAMAVRYAQEKAGGR